MTQAATSIPRPDDPAEALAWLRGDEAAIRQAEIAKFKHTCDYVAMYLVDPFDGATYDEVFGSTELTLAGEGAPGVDEFAVLEYAAALGLSPYAGKRYVGAVMEIRYRLPRVLKEVGSGRLPFWKAQLITDATLNLSREAAEFVDLMVAPMAASSSAHRIGRWCEEVIVQFDPDVADAKREAGADQRRFDVRLDDVSFDGIVHIDAALDLPDALDLNDAVTAGADQLARLGDTDPLDVRRARAAGQLARGQATLQFDTSHADDEPEVEEAAEVGRGGRPGARHETRPSRDRRSPRPIVVHVGLADLAVSTSSTTGGRRVGTCDAIRGPIAVEQVRQWAGNPNATVVIQPIIDLNANIVSEGRFVEGRLRIQTALIDRTCVFPGCTRPAELCDRDHIVPYDDGGKTETVNIACLCRTHHRAKTHGRFTYGRLAPGTYLWTTPQGYRILRDHRGTHQPLPPAEP